MKSKNSKIYCDIIISCAEYMVKNWEGFAQVWPMLLTDRNISEEDP